MFFPLLLTFMLMSNLNTWSQLKLSYVIKLENIKRKFYNLFLNSWDDLAFLCEHFPLSCVIFYLSWFCSFDVLVRRLNFSTYQINFRHNRVLKYLTIVTLSTIIFLPINTFLIILRCPLINWVLVLFLVICIIFGILRLGVLIDA